MEMNEKLTVTVSAFECASGRFMGFVKEIPGAVSLGSSIDELKVNIEAAIKAIIVSHAIEEAVKTIAINESTNQPVNELETNFLKLTRRSKPVNFSVPVC